VQRTITLKVQKIIDSEDEKDYESKRDLLIRQLQSLRLNVTVEAKDEIYDLVEQCENCPEETKGVLCYICENLSGRG